MLKIRLARVGKKNSPSYRVVVAEQKMAVKRKFIEIIGNYNPSIKPKQLVINKERAIFWMGQGAQPSDTIRNLMCDLGILDKKEKSQKVFGKKLTKKAIKEGGEKKPEMAKASDEGQVTSDEKIAEETPATEVPDEQTPSEEITEAVEQETPVEEVADETAAEATEPEAEADKPE